jgi:hypothetical protein
MTHQLFALVPVPDAKSVPDNAVMWGTLEECLTGLDGTPSHQELLDIQAAIPPVIEQVQQFQKDRQAFYGTLHQAIDAQNARLDAFEKQRAISMKRQEAEQKRRDRQRVQSYLDGLPDLDEPEPWPDNGELTIKHKVDPKYLPEDDAALSTTLHDTALGLEAVTATRPTTDPAQLAYPPSRSTQQVPQPIAISLNEE